MLKYLLISTMAAFAAMHAQADSLYRCEVLDVLELGAGGKLERSDWAKMLDGIDEVIVFDSKSGLFRYEGQNPSSEYQVLETGDEANSMKAVRVVNGPATVVLETIRINTFSDLEFIHTSGDVVRTGKCDKL